MRKNKLALFTLALCLVTSLSWAKVQNPSEIDEYFHKHYIVNTDMADSANDILGCLAGVYINDEGFREVRIATSANCLKSQEELKKDKIDNLYEFVQDHGSRLRIEEFYKVDKHAEANVLAAFGFIFERKKVYLNSLVQTDVTKINPKCIDWNKFREFQEEFINGIVDSKGKPIPPKDIQVFVIKSVMGLALGSTKTHDSLQGMFARALHYNSSGLADHADSASSKKTRSALVLTPCFDHHRTVIQNSRYEEKGYKEYQELLKHGHLRLLDDGGVTLSSPEAKRRKHMSIPFFTAEAARKTVKIAEGPEDILDTTADAILPEDPVFEESWAHEHKEIHPENEVSNHIVTFNEGQEVSEALETEGEFEAQITEAIAQIEETLAQQTQIIEGEVLPEEQVKTLAKNLETLRQLKADHEAGLLEGTSN